MPLINVQLPENELRVARCDMLDKLIAVGDGDAALLYLYILRNGGVEDGKQAARALHLSGERYERALFTLNNLTAPAAAQDADKPDEAPHYTADELRRARLDDHKFSAVCQAAEQTLGRTLTEGQLRCLLTAYDHLGLEAGAIIELLAWLKSERGTVRLADIRREANQWADMGVVSVQAAQQYLARRADEKPLNEALYKAMDADPAQPSPKEQRVCRFALAHGFPPEAVALAVRRTGRQQGHKSLDYTLGILRRWDAAGVHTVSEITALEPETGAARQAAGQMAAQPTDGATLAAWEQEWLEQKREIRRRRQEAE
ncbi:MAG: DnaD domain protein [Agathobaculum sp.]|uniref:DnaD domain protein n=1 Tax=Agathobaculum sp. TaxID=2048138 RepID=UPI003D8F42F4